LVNEFTKLPIDQPTNFADYKMHRRSRVRIGFCVSYPVGSTLALGSKISTQAMPGSTVVFLYLAVVWFVLYAACGALPYVAAGAEKRMVAAAFWGYGIGGVAAGELVAILVMSGNLASHARVLGAFAVPATIPWLLGFVMTRWLAAGGVSIADASSPVSDGTRRPAGRGVHRD
jgi:hypothetical protein